MCSLEAVSMVLNVIKLFSTVYLVETVSGNSKDDPAQFVGFREAFDIMK